MTTRIVLAPTPDTMLTVRAARGPILLAETDIDRVAAAGSKIGSGTEGRCRPGSPRTQSV